MDTPLLPHDDAVLLQVAHVDLLAGALDGRVRRQHQPAHVREEEAAARVVGVGVRLGVAVVHPVVQHPRPDVPLREDDFEKGPQAAPILCDWSRLRGWTAYANAMQLAIRAGGV